MKELFKKYKSVVLFIVLFLGTYLVLSTIYSYYLKASVTGGYYPDYITNLVATQSAAILDALGYFVVMEEYDGRVGMLIIIENTYAVNIVEGCNSVSVVILFVSFIISFAERFKKTVLFLLAGAVLIYIVNLLRIVLLVVASYKYPEYQEVLHSVIFPAIIYGMVFILWVVWVRMLNDNSTKDETDT